LYYHNRHAIQTRVHSLHPHLVISTFYTALSQSWFEKHNGIMTFNLAGQTATIGHGTFLLCLK